MSFPIAYAGAHGHTRRIAERIPGVPRDQSIASTSAMCASSNAARSRMPNTGAGLAVDDDRHAEKPRRRVPRREDLRPGVVAQGRDAQLMNSHGAGVLILTSAESPSTMCARPSDSGP